MHAKKTLCEYAKCYWYFPVKNPNLKIVHRNDWKCPKSSLTCLPHLPLHTVKTHLCGPLLLKYYTYEQLDRCVYIISK